MAFVRAVGRWRGIIATDPDHKLLMAWISGAFMGTLLGYAIFLLAHAVAGTL